MTAAQQQAGEPDGARYRILLVDDDIDDRAIGARMLENAAEIDGVTCFESAAALMSFIRSEGLRHHCALDRISLMVVVDINMPRVDGYHVLQGLKSDPAFDDIPVLVVSGILDYTGMRKALDMGADGVFRKPIDIAKIRGFLKRSMPGESAHA